MLTQEEIDNMNCLVSIKTKFNLYFKTTTQRKQGLNGECYQTSKEQIIQILYNFFHKTEESVLKDSFIKANITLITKTDKYTLRKENYHLISLTLKNAKSTTNF